jgi:hypothetical protein
MHAVDGLTTFASVLALLASLLFCFHSCFYGWSSLLLLVAVVNAVAFIPDLLLSPLLLLASLLLLAFLLLH